MFYGDVKHLGIIIKIYSAIYTLYLYEQNPKRFNITTRMF